MTNDTTAKDALTYDLQIALLNRLARASLPRWGLDPSSAVRLINLSENATFLVEPPLGDKVILRIHREGYHSKHAIGCELAWMRALREEAGVITPEPLAGVDGEPIQSGAVPGLPCERHMVLFGYIEGEEPDATQDLRPAFERLGEVSARLHEHAIGWRLPKPFERLHWDDEHIIGAKPNWGDWRVAPAMDATAHSVLQRLEDVVRRRLAAFGRERDRFGLIHADIRLANLLVDDDSTRVIDFDDCGFGWFLYDVATTVSFIEDHRDVPAWIDAWLAGYHRVRTLSEAEIAEIPTFIMLRRLALLAWIGSHAETDLAKEQGVDFTRVSCNLADNYLRSFG